MRNVIGLLTCIATVLVEAVDFEGPRPTVRSMEDWDFAGWTPKPTKAPIPYRQLGDLKHRRQTGSVVGVPPPLQSYYTSQTKSVCGYVDGNGAWPYSCNNKTEDCVFGNFHTYFACCASNSAASYTSCLVMTPPVSCFDYTNAGYCTGECTSGNGRGYPLGTVCPVTAPYCTEASVVGTMSDGSRATWTQFGCGTQSSFWSLDVIATYFLSTPLPTTNSIWSGATTNINPTHGLAIPSSSITAVSSSAVSPTLSIVPLTQTQSTTIGSSTAPASSEPSSSKSLAGPIAGGVLGGLVALGAIATAIFFWHNYQRKKEARHRAANSISEVDQNDSSLQESVTPNKNF